MYEDEGVVMPGAHQNENFSLNTAPAIGEEYWVIFGRRVRAFFWEGCQEDLEMLEEKGVFLSEMDAKQAQRLQTV